MSDLSIEKEFDQARAQIKSNLIEGIVRAFGKYCPHTFEHVFSFHMAAMKMMVKREEELQRLLSERQN